MQPCTKFTCGGVTIVIISFHLWLFFLTDSLHGLYVLPSGGSDPTFKARNTNANVCWKDAWHHKEVCTSMLCRKKSNNLYWYLHDGNFNCFWFWRGILNFCFPFYVLRFQGGQKLTYWQEWSVLGKHTVPNIPTKIEKDTVQIMPGAVNMEKVTRMACNGEVYLTMESWRPVGIASSTQEKIFLGKCNISSTVLLLEMLLLLLSLLTFWIRLFWPSHLTRIMPATYKGQL